MRTGTHTLDTGQLLTVLTAVKKGDFSARMPLDRTGIAGKIADALNDVIELNEKLCAELARISTIVGKEGKTARRASIGAADGAWATCVDAVNSLIVDLMQPTTEVARVISAVAHGDLSQSMALEIDGRPLTGEFLRTAKTANTMVAQLGAFASEVTRVAREVGTEGKLGRQAEVEGVSGTWKDLTVSVNSMANNLTSQVRNIAEVTTAVAKGDLSKKITVDVRGEILELKDTINTMVDQLNGFASEVTRVAREVGTEGKLAGQAQVKGVSGIWKDLTQSVNLMANNLTSQVRNIAEVTTAVANGDLTKKITVDAQGEIQDLKNTINTMVDQLNSFASEVTRVAWEVGTEGKLAGQAQVKGVSGTWKDLTDNVNSMANNLTSQVRNIAEVTTAVANGDLSKKITVDVRGEILELKNTINTMVDQLNSFASEVTRVAREVGTEGKLAGQAEVEGVSGTWKDLTVSVNSMASNLTSQVRGIARVVTAVANGNLKQKLVLEAKGEIAELAETINAMIDTLATFADQVTSVAREVGIEGKLGGQASVPGAAGTWRDLTDNVNRLATTLTTQIRAIAEVATAVTTGDLSRSITVEAAGEVEALKDNINEMIRNLRDTTRINTEQDWLKTNVARFTRLLQGQRDPLTVCRLILSELAPLVSVQHGVFYINEASSGEPVLKLLASYGYQQRKSLANQFRPGEGLVGQSVLEKQRILLTEVPGDYVKIRSGLGEAPPHNIVVLPVLFESEVLAVIELASFNRFSEIHLTFLDQLTDSIGIVLNTVAATMRTEELLKQSQSLTQELQNRQQELQETNRRLEQQAQSLQASEDRLKEQQEELQQANEELEERARLLTGQNREVERQNRQIELAREELEEKAEQLMLTSKYKNEFLANMSHELRTPLNSMLILSRLLADNAEGNLTPKQVEYASTVHSSGDDLLALINEILDLAKIESGTMEVHVADVPFRALQDYVERNFREVAQEKDLDFTIELDEGECVGAPPAGADRSARLPNLPDAIYTDPQRLQQVLRNLLSNAFKFTQEGRVTLRMQVATGGWSRSHEILPRADPVIAFAVSDTGIGIPKDRQKLIFEAFQQGDGTTNRKYGGTGLGLSISREIAGLLGGEITVVSSPGEGSTFTLYLPQAYWPAGPRSDRSGKAGSGPSATADAVRDSGAAQLEGAATSPPRPAHLGSAGGSGPSASEADRSLLLPGDISDDRSDIQSGDHVLLIVEDDVPFARILLDRARDKGFKGIVTSKGESVLSLARRFRPHALTLDIRLPDVDGWTVLDRLKHDPETRHIPVHIISVTEERQRGLEQGAIAYLNKPVTREALDQALATMKQFIERDVKRLLVVEDDEAQRSSIVELMGDGDVQTSAVGTGAEALAALKSDLFDCVVLDLGLPDMTGFELIEKIRNEVVRRELPIVVYTARKLTKKEETELKRLANTIIVKGVQSPERLLDETTLFLHRVQANLPAPNRQMLEQSRLADPVLAGKKVLIVDDDIRNIFALTSLLERHQMQVVYAENGRDGIEMLQNTSDIGIVLMDVMMPEMDGYEAMRAIRNRAEFKSLPIIALTAKAMKGDREKCIEAGASDYIAKPVDPEQLLSLLRVWLYR
jgi:signal transduction histidine kinase/CheY-like chemotaxis protein/HAMP domain-containing protein